MKTLIIRRAFPRVELREGGAAEAWAAGANAQNSLFLVWIFAGIKCRAAVAAQELYEHRFTLLAGFVAAAVAFALGGTLAGQFAPDWWWIVLPISALAFLAVPQARFVLHRMEVRSHEVEVQAAQFFHGADANLYRKQEAAAMVRRREGERHLGYKWLRKMTAVEIEKAMRRHSDAALSWVIRCDILLDIRDADFERDAK